MQGNYKLIVSHLIAAGKNLIPFVNVPWALLVFWTFYIPYLMQSGCLPS